MCQTLHDVNLSEKPFHLNQDGVDWVKQTIESMTLEEKIGQLFCPIGFTDDPDALKMLTRKIGIGGIMYRPGEGKAIQQTHRLLQENANIPLLIAANLEAGGNGVATDGTNFGKPMQAGATANPKMGYALGKISCSEGASVGCNWSFAPIVDIDYNFRNPITNLRTFGNDPDLVIQMASGYLRAADEENVAVSIKHFPGDGMDERDQHLVTSVNTLSVEEWDASYGKIYQTLIDQGAKTVMIGHIAHPAYQKHFDPKTDRRPVPATLSKALICDLLRGKLNFQGLVVSDATSMLGFTTYIPRKDAVPYSIACGNDMFLFNKSLEEDYGYMMEGYRNGVFSEERLHQAVTRILATKASLNLHQKQQAGTLVPGPEALSILGCEEHTKLAKQCAKEAVTLVKNHQNLIPLNATKHKRLLLNVLEPNDAVDSPLRTKLKGLFEQEGFDVTIRDRDVNVDMAAFMNGKPDPKIQQLIGEVFAKVDDFTSQFDLVVYVANFETASNTTVIRLGWKGLLGMGNDSPWFTAELPTVFISLANPYHMLDVPMIDTFVNAYTNNEYVLEALMNKLMGRDAFIGKSPVDPFCGRTDMD